MAHRKQGRKWAKTQANRQVRRMKKRLLGNFPNWTGYRKAYPQYDIYD